VPTGLRAHPSPGPPPLRRRRAPRSTIAMVVDHIPRCSCSWYAIQLHDRVVHVLQEFMLEAGATKGRDLRLEVFGRDLLEIDLGLLCG
jgi:hypothetical protein